MARCLACDKNLSDFESTRKYEHGEYIDLCGKCFKDSGICVSLQREDLSDEYEDIGDVDNEYDYIEKDAEDVYWQGTLP